MTKLVDLSKTQLGKLLASENIRIEHRQIRGPYFDVKDRVLALPIWADVSNDLYDLMIGHEVGHALFTPAEGWEEEVKTKKNLKTFLNIIEDARIEKKMKRKYPGLRKPMYNGYTELVERGFFGMTFDEMQEMPFVDRLNVHFKLGSRANIDFTEKEQEFIARVDDVETWDEVMLLANELYDITEKEKEDKEEEFDFIDESEESDDVDNGDDSDEVYGTQSSPSEDSSESDSPESQDTDRTESKSKPKQTQNTSEFVEDKMREWAYSDEPTSITHDAMKRHEESLIDESAYPLQYTYWPTLNLKDWVVPAKVTYDTMVFDPLFEKTGDELYKNFMSSNRRYISYMVKEFELRRNAKQFAKAKVSKTGDLDIKKIWKYKLSEDLFLQSTTVPNGKNHGMLMVVDMSSSMQSNMKGTIEQVINLALFCRKVNIPFEVYGFIDNNHAKMEGMDVDVMSGVDTVTRKRNDTQDKTLYIHNVHFRLKELLNSKMKLTEFNMSVKKLLLLAKAHQQVFGYYTNHSYLVPPSMQLSGTPLNETILVLRHVAEKFKRETKVEILNTIILTDGDASYFPSFISNNEIKYVNRSHTVVEDKLSTKRVLLKGNATLALIQLYKEITGSRVIGFYLMDSRNCKTQIREKMYYTENFNFDQFETQYKTEFLNHKYFGVKMQGYDVYYMVPGDELEVEQVDMTKVMKPSDKTTKNTLYRAFKKMQNTKMTSRVFLNQFIMQVA
jgi:hypothetical protein